jgi:hypothetical protein
MKLTPVQSAIVAAAALAAAFAWLPGADPSPEASAPGLPPVAEMLALRHLAKGQLARDAAAGSRSLWQAAALSAALDALPPETPETPAAPGPPVSAEERLCRRVIVMIDCLLEDPARAAAVARFEAELLEAQNGTGGLRLPDVDPRQVQELLADARTRLTRWHWGTGHP